MAKNTRIYDTKAQFTLALKQAISTRNWQKVSEVVQTAEQAAVAKLLRKKAWFLVGEYELGRKNYPAAVLSFNSARTLELGNEKTLQGLIGSMEGFYKRHESEFSREDLLLLASQWERLTNFYQTHQRTSDKNLKRAHELQKLITLRLEQAPSKEETPATPHVLKIVAALYSPNMTPEEVRAEFARIVAPLILERYDESQKKKRKKKGKRKDDGSPAGDIGAKKKP